MIKPTIGRRVWYWPSDYDLGLDKMNPPSVIEVDDRSQPCDAGVTYVHHEHLVNLTVADHNGNMHKRSSVFLLQDGNERPSCRTTAFAEWMPYQKTAQAAPVKATVIPEFIARVCHEVNRAYCQALGDNSQPSWEDAPEWQRSSALLGVRLHTDNHDAGPHASHESWMKQKLEEGWVYGPVKSPSLKQHPCMVPFDQLPREQQAKDFIFRAIVLALQPSA